MVQKEKKYITWEGLNQHAKNVGKKIKEYDAGVIGGYNGSFPLTAATKGNIYLLPATKKYYVCIENYNGSQLTAPNANFEELSVYTNRSKLDNLSGFSITLKGNSESKELPNGLYWVSYYHGGLVEQNYLSVVAFTSYKETEQNNKWLKCEKIISQINAEFITFEYNAYLRKMRNPSPYERKIKLTPINL